MEKENGRVSVLMWALGMALAFTAAINGWSVAQIFALTQRVTVIEASRFGAKDGLQVWEAIDNIRTKIAKEDEKASEREDK